MTLDIERIKTTRLGRLWLSRFVERIWDEVLVTQEHRRLLDDTRIGDGWLASIRPPRGLSGLYVIRWGSGSSSDDCLLAMGLLKDVGSRRKLTPLGVEVYSHGRRVAQASGRESERVGSICSGPMGGPGAGPRRRA